jgi:hypothetical protein
MEIIASIANFKLPIKFPGVSTLTSSSIWLAQKWTVEFDVNRNRHLGKIMYTEQAQINLQQGDVDVWLTSIVYTKQP